MDQIVNEINTHELTLNFGKYRDQRLVRVPVSYLRWMSNSMEDGSWWQSVAAAELKRRGTPVPKVDLTPHAIDRASTFMLRQFSKRKNRKLGFYTWLSRRTLSAITKGRAIGSDDPATPDQLAYWYAGVRYVVIVGNEFPVLKTVVDDSKGWNDGKAT